VRKLPPDLLGEGYTQITKEQAVALSQLGASVEWDICKKGEDFYPVTDWDWSPFWDLYYGWYREEYDMFFRTRTE